MEVGPGAAVVTLRAPSSQQIASQIEAVLKRMPEARLIGIRSASQRPWPRTIERLGHRFQVMWSDSGLELRERLAAMRADGEGLVVLTNLSDEVLGNDLLARFAKARLLLPNSWDMLRDAFQARDVDPRLGGEDWLAELLLEHAPVEGYPPVPGGVLDADTAWRHVLAHTIGLNAVRPDIETLLEWSLDDSGLNRFLSLPAEVRTRIGRRVEGVGGGAAGLIMGAVAAGHGASLVALCLVLDVVFARTEERELRDAAVRLEPLFGRRIDQAPGQRLAFAASRLIARISNANAEACQIRTTEFLEKLHIANFARFSDFIALGFDQRLQHAAAILLHAVEHGAVSQDAAKAIEQVCQHDRARVESVRVARIQMALRLARWLATPEKAFTRFAEAASNYAQEGGFVDLARMDLLGADPLSEISAIYVKLVERATARRERENKQFARALATWEPDSAAFDAVLPVEFFLDRILAAIAANFNVLLIVLDGLSYPVHRRLMPDLLRQGWTELMPEKIGKTPSLVAALPSVTDASRTSLLCGQISRGRAADERIYFANHSSLLACSRAEKPPLLFHKAALQLGTEQADKLHKAIANPQQRIVGVVHNVVDAQLDGSDQLEVHWAADDLRSLSALLSAARTSGRIVVITGDHGHMLDNGTVQHTAEGGNRWRHAKGTERDFELTFEGHRVLAPDGTNRIVMPWSEAVRYGGKSRGYHGGATPQEMVIPLAVLTTHAIPHGWSVAPPVQPVWWDQMAIEAPLVQRSSRRQAMSGDESQIQLFEEPGFRAPEGWIDQLLATSTFNAQRRLAGRAAPRDDDIRGLLRILDERGGRLSQTALAQALGLPLVRISGLVSAAARVLNVDQARILHFDRSSQTVTLDRGMLDLQFELGKQ